MEKVRAQNRKRVENYRKRIKEGKQAAKENIDNKFKEEIENINTEEKQSDIKIDGNNSSDELNCLEDINKDNNEENIEKIEETINPNSNIIEEKSCDSDSNNIINSHSNVTLTEQNKKENKKENKIKKKDIKKENANNPCDVKDKNLICDEDNKSSTRDEEEIKSSFFEQHNNTKSEAANEEDINLKALELMHYHEKITGKVGGCDYVALRAAIEIHGEKRVKMAMEVGFERNCPDIKYAIGVLKNWRRDGYPEDFKEVKNNGAGRNGKSNSADKNEFAGFKPKEPRKLTEAERRKIEANLI